ncbi:MAG: Uma2 family endonuclease [Tannerella sp.]|jgi:Uma2 family endonuclease|nr:Uma2 family endonuclease [Tannerella sp.]
MMDVSLDLNRRYTYADYLTWLDDRRRELIDGMVRLMSPAPKRIHQRISFNITHSLANELAKLNCGCHIYNAPFDVRLPKNGEKEDEKIYTVVQPDICVVCDLTKLDERGCLGAPDLIIEIQSPSSAKYDLNTKFNLYEAAGVREYWVTPQAAGYILKFVLQSDGKYDEGTVYEKGKIGSTVLEGLEIDLNDIF